MEALWALVKRRGVILAIFLLCTVLLIASTTNVSRRTFGHAPATPYLSNDKPIAPPPPALKHGFNPRNFLLTQKQCHDFFPDLFQDIDRAVRDRKGANVTLGEINKIPLRNGYVRGMIYNQQLYVINTEGQIYSRGLATLLAINRALTTSPEPLPNIEFTFSVDDKLEPLAQWALARKASDTTTWLMPDFAYWSWPETHVGSYGEIQDKAVLMEETTDNPTGRKWEWSAKIPKLMWRGALMTSDVRKKLMDVSKDQPWADVKALDWHNKASTDTDLKSMDEHCQFKYLINTAGNSYSGRLKFIQNCRSVILMHDDEWFTHHTHLMRDSGPDQNFVRVRRDLSDLEATIRELQRDDARARRIADNNVKVMRERYLTPAAEACYWRQLFRSWRAVTFEPEFYKEKDGKRVWRGLPFESYALERRLTWNPY